MTSTIKSVYRLAVSQLRTAGVSTPELDARILLQHAIGARREDFSTISEAELSADSQHKLTAMIQRRIAREPVSRIIGTREFWGLEFLLSPATLDPRPDSETVVEAAISVARRQSLVVSNRPFRILDLGTGTGCLLLSILHGIPNATGLGIDISPKAVETAHENAKQLGLADRAEFAVENWIEGITERFDLVISNPPYIPHAEIKTLEPEVAKFEPLAALDGGEDGLEAYRIIAAGLHKVLKPSGKVVLEVGYGQAQSVSAIMQSHGLRLLGVQKDLGGVERTVIISTQNI